MTTSQTALGLKAELIAAFPGGTERMWDWNHPDGPGPFNEAAAQVLDVAGVQMIDQLRAELQPNTAVAKLPEWESALGLRGSKLALIGRTRQRQTQVVSRLREWGSATTLDCIRSIVGPLLDYADPSQLIILEVDRDVLRAAHTYTWTGLLSFTTLPAALFVNVLDDAVVSPAGAQLDITINYAGSLANVGVNLFAPDGTFFQYPAGTIGDTTPATGTWRLYFKGFGGRPITGVWQAQITCSSGFGNILSAGLFVEGLGRDSTGREGLGAAKFQWAVVVDPALVGPYGDIQAAAHAVERINYATRRGLLIRKPLTGLAAIPDDPATIPDACIPG